LAKTKAEMHARGCNYRFTPQLLEEEGVDPREGLTALASLVRGVVDAGGAVVGHNIVSFDYPILSRVCREWTDTATFEPPIDRIIDTLCVARARQKRDFALPKPGETRRNWFDRLVRGPEKCAMFDYCLPTFGVPFDPAKAHMAVYDTLVNHLLLERFRQLSSA
jgi:DNA polymerase III epsilon subunit-like protein